MTTSTYAIRADRLPEGLCWIAAHGDIPGGLAWRHEDGCVTSCDGEWIVTHEAADHHWGDPLVAIPRDLAAASTDPAIRAWAKSSINQKEQR